MRTRRERVYQRGSAETTAERRLREKQRELKRVSQNHEQHAEGLATRDFALDTANNPQQAQLRRFSGRPRRRAKRPTMGSSSLRRKCHLPQRPTQGLLRRRRKNIARWHAELRRRPRAPPSDWVSENASSRLQRRQGEEPRSTTQRQTTARE